MPRTHLLGRAIALLTSFLFFYGGQAHLTDEYTPDLAAQIVISSQGAEKAWWFFSLDAEQVCTFTSLSHLCLNLSRQEQALRSMLMLRWQIRHYFGIYAIITALLLVIPQTSRKALRLACGFTCLALYSAWYNGFAMFPQAVALVVQVVGLLTI